MQKMSKDTIDRYSILMDFLSQSLGPNYEFILYDMSEERNCIVAITAPSMSGQAVGDKPNRAIAELFRDCSHEYADFKVNYCNILVKNKAFRTSSMFIRDENGEPHGILSMNFDDAIYHDVSAQILKICHPDQFIYDNVKAVPLGAASNIYPNSKADEILEQITADSLVPVERMTMDEKLEIIKTLYDNGAFQAKGAVQEIAKRLNCSQASMYRYLKIIQI